jgi:hypothetical protein
MTMPRFAVGDQVEIFAFGRWRPGRVVALGRVRITVEYSTRDGVVSKTGDFSSGRVRSAAATRRRAGGSP